MGKSSTGKDTIFKNLLADKDLNLKTIVSYTTRPIRDGEQDGVEYYFVDDTKIAEAKENNTLLELRSYHTFHGTWKYFTLADHQIDLNSSDYIMIGTLESFVPLKAYFGEQRVVPILIDLDDGDRLQRALDRERAQENPRYQELCRRFLADASDFSEELVEKTGVKKKFYNDNLERCLQEIKQYISSLC